jgi:hypothetical protein
MRQRVPVRPMSRLAAMVGRTQISLLLCAFAFGIAGCGGSSDGSIPQEQAGDLLALLDTLQTDVQAGECDHVTGTADEFASRVEQLPSDVDSDVRNELTKAAAHLDQLAGEASSCTPVETGATGPAGVETTTETTTPDETTTTSTTDETSTTEETTTTTTDEAPPTEPEGNGGGNGQQPDEAPAPPPSDNEGQGSSGGGGVSPSTGGVGPGGGGG